MLGYMERKRERERERERKGGSKSERGGRGERDKDLKYLCRWIADMFMFIFNSPKLSMCGLDHDAWYNQTCDCTKT